MYSRSQIKPVSPAHCRGYEMKRLSVIHAPAKRGLTRGKGWKMKAALATLVGVFFLSTFAAADPIVPAVPDVARPLPLTAVRLTGGPLKLAQVADAKYLLELEPDRM